MKKVLKTVFVCVLALLELMLVLLYAGMWYFDDYMGTTITATDIPGLLVTFGGFLVVSLAEVVRIIKKKEFIIIPMLGMKLVFFVAGIATYGYVGVLSGDMSYLGMTITMTIMTIVLVIAGFGIKYMGRQPKISHHADTELAARIEQSRFTRYSAEWNYDDVYGEYCELHGIDASDPEYQLPDEANDEIYIYACDYIAYLFLWLAKRDGLCFDEVGDDVQNEIELMIADKSDPRKILYNYYDAKFCASDVKESFLNFLHDYYERNGINLQPRAVSYAVDYEEIVLSDVKNGNIIPWCRAFNYEAYGSFEKVLDDRYESFNRNYCYEDLITYAKHEKFYAHAFNMEMEVYVQQVEPQYMAEFDAYVEKCLEEIDNMPESTLEMMNNDFKSWDLDMSVDEMKKSLSGGEVNIYRPYGKELAYNLIFGADFEQEHGVSVVIRDKKVLFTGYSMDAPLPFSDEMEAEFKRVALKN